MIGSYIEGGGATCGRGVALDQVSWGKGVRTRLNIWG